MEREQRSRDGEYGEKEGYHDSLIVLLFLLSVKTSTLPNQELEICFQTLPRVPWGTGGGQSKIALG